MFINVTLNDGTLVERIEVEDEQQRNPGFLTAAATNAEVQEALDRGLRMQDAVS